MKTGRINRRIDLPLHLEFKIQRVRIDISSYRKVAWGLWSIMKSDTFRSGRYVITYIRVEAEV